MIQKEGGWMEKVGKTYRLKNGYGIAKCRLYDGYTMQYFWGIFKPDNTIHSGNYQSYEKAYEVAKDLRG